MSSFLPSSSIVTHHSKLLSAFTTVHELSNRLEWPTTSRRPSSQVRLGRTVAVGGRIVIIIIPIIPVEVIRVDTDCTTALLGTRDVLVGLELLWLFLLGNSGLNRRIPGRGRSSSRVRVWRGRKLRLNTQRLLSAAFGPQ
jgi:hypothetical protein